MSVDNGPGIQTGVNTEINVLPEFKIENVRNYEYGTLIRELVKKYDEGYVPNLDESKILFCEWMSLGSKKNDSDSLPWSDVVIDKTQNICDGLDMSSWGYNTVALSDKERSVIRDDDNTDWDADRIVMNMFFKKMDNSDLIELNRYVIRNYSIFDNCVSLQNWSYAGDILPYLGLNRIDKNINTDLGLESDFLDLIYSLDKNETIYEKDYAIDFFYNEGNYKNGFLRAFSSNLINSCINWDKPEEIKNKTMGILLKHYGTADVVNIIREELKTGNLSDDEILRYEAFGKLILDLPEKAQLHTDLDSVYKKIDFESYELSKKTEEFRVNMINNLFDDLGVDKADKIMDLACGTGWLVGDLIETGYKNIVGVDVSEKNLSIAKENYGDNFLLGDWYHLAENFDKQKVILCLGRALSHVENYDNFRYVIKNIASSLEDNGYFIFDMPDPEIQGSEYQKGILEYKNVLKKFGFNDSELENIYTIIDSPDGDNFYNRYVPSRSIVDGLITGYRFEVLKLVEEKLPGSEKDKNLVFVCRKRKDIVLERVSVLQDKKEKSPKEVYKFFPKN